MTNDLIPNYIKRIFFANPQIGRKDLAKQASITEGEARFYCKLYKDSKKTSNIVKRGVALFDIHYPDHDIACMNIVKEFLKDFKPHHLLLVGDQLNMDSISFYNTDRPKLTEGKRLKQEFKGFQEKILDELEAQIPSKCKKYFFIGNHEYRINRLIEKNPQYEGFVEVENNLNLKDYKIIPFNEVIQIGNMYFAHGIYFNKYYAERTLRHYQKMLFIGHAHFPQIHTAVSPIDSLPKQCVGVGCLCNKNPSYKVNQPNAWVHQFLYWYMFGDGTFSYYIVTIINGRCVINNKVYDGNK
jgi:hypothetical protein